MKVLFGYSADFSLASAVCWQGHDGSVRERVLRKDGRIVEYSHPHESLLEMWVELGGECSPLCPAEVPDLSSAFSYLGKPADLVESLPKAIFDD